MKDSQKKGPSGSLYTGKPVPLSNLLEHFEEGSVDLYQKVVRDEETHCENLAIFHVAAAIHSGPNDGSTVRDFLLKHRIPFWEGVRVLKNFFATKMGNVWDDEDLEDFYTNYYPFTQNRQFMPVVQEIKGKWVTDAPDAGKGKGVCMEGLTYDQESKPIPETGEDEGENPGAFEHKYEEVPRKYHTKKRFNNLHNFVLKVIRLENRVADGDELRDRLMMMMPEACRLTDYS